jgi:TRAP-type C4-dicarboxylate transport system substrate-binding protein
MEEFQSLQKGVVNAGFACAGGALGIMKYYEVIKYLTLSSKSPGQLGVSINLDAYKKLPADLQKAMVDEGNKYQEDMAAAMKKFYEDAYALCQQNGVTFYYLPETERTRWKTTCAPIITDYWKQIGGDAAGKMQAWIKQANDKIL